MISRSAALLYVAIVLGLVLILWSTRRERESHVRVPQIDRFQEALPSIAGLTGSPIQAGNRVEVLQDGDDFFPALLRDVEAAQHNIHLETYVWWTGEICGQVARALAGKARQGVEVRLSFGIEIFEHQRTLVHQKVMIVDGLWSHVGSTNFDDRSFDINDEASVGLIDPGVAAQLRAAFERDLQACEQVRLEEWRRRSAWHRFIDRGSYLINEQI